MKRIWIIVLAAVLALLVTGAYFSWPGHAPAGQPVLVELDSPALSALQTEFNRTSGSLRVILLLSPT
jgi:hypothetical protein